MKKVFIATLCLLCFACSRPDLMLQLQNAKWIDLTHDYDSTTVYWPTDVNFRHDTVFYGMTEKGYFYSSFKYAAEEHGGTHFDAPIHFHKGGNTIDQVPVSQLHGPAVVIDIKEKCARNRDYLITTDDVNSWEHQHGRIPEGAIIILNTGYGKFWNDHQKYTGTLKKGPEGVAELHFPGLSPEASTWIITYRKVNAIGLDTPSIDFGQSKDFQTHRILTAASLTMYENLCNLDELPSTGAYIVALPMKIKGGSGSPLRIVAIIAQKEQ
ncbi:MAG: cyclase family protein [Bacteroidota bacterium]|jgi:kynurenine formamidase